MRPQGDITRGTTHPNRLRRVDRWLLWRHARLLREPGALVVDLGYGRVPLTTIELWERLGGVEVVGLEIDPARVVESDRPGLRFARGGFELAGLRPTVVRAMNVLRQYAEEEVPAAWRTITGGLRPGGVLVEGTCDELGRLGCWVAVPAASATPDEVVFSAHLATLGDPARLAERLPKALIHRNVPGERVHALLRDWSAAWVRTAPLTAYGPRTRFVAAAAGLRDVGWPVTSPASRLRLGELALPWSAVSPL